MLRTVYRRLMGNKWKAVSIIVGLVMAAAIAFSIPVYSDAILQRILSKNLAEIQLDTGKYPGYLSFEYSMTSLEKDSAAMVKNVEDAFVNSGYMEDIPRVLDGRVYRFEMFEREFDKVARRYDRIVIYYMENLASHVNITVGRMFNPDRDDGVVEVVVNHKYMVRSPNVMGTVYEYDSLFPNEEGIKLEVVGAYEMLDPTDVFWFTDLDSENGTMLCDKGYFEKRIAREPAFSRHFTRSLWYSAFDYNIIKPETVESILFDLSALRFDLLSRTGNDKVTFNAEATLSNYMQLRGRVMVNLYILIIPIFVLLAFYIMMVAKIKIDSEQNELSVMQSRGANKRSVLKLYLIESAFMVSVSLVAGPPIGLFLCKIIGAANGFLEFVSRTALPLRVVPVAFISLGATAALFFLILMIPAVFGASVNILESKRRKTRKKQPFWQKYFLDVLLLGVAAYGFYSMEKTMQLIDALGEGATVGNTDFLLYLLSTIFALGAGMLFLRVYPLLVRLIFRLGRRIWPAGIYATLNRVARSRENAPIMLFIILTLAIGIFSANAARSINTHIENNELYSIGSDIIYRPKWRQFDANGNEILGPVNEATGIVTIMDDGVEIQSTKVYFYALLPEAFEQFKEIESMSRYYKDTSGKARKGSTRISNVTCMAIDPYDFGVTIYPVRDKNTYHINQYLNALIEYPEGFIISASLQAALGVAVGDTIQGTYLPGVAEGKVVAVVDSWPGYNPMLPDGNGVMKQQHLLVGTLENLFSSTGVEVKPYSFLIKKAEGVSDVEMNRVLKESSFGLTAIESANSNIIEQKNNPVLQGTNGMLSVSFLVSVIICALGFMIFWIISIKQRSLQFGISRALGMRKGGVLAMLITEQLLVSGVATVAGVLVGSLGSRLFVPMLAMNYASPGQTIAFRVVSSGGDLLRVMVIMSAMLIACFAVLSAMAIHLKIDRALKLGED